MAERRMFAKSIIDSDAFLDMPTSTQLLYFHLSMRADDDGFINSPKKILRIVNASDDDLKLLIAKKFIIPFESGVVVIKHWKIHNYIRNDRYNETNYKFEKSQLRLDENSAYTQTESLGIPLGSQSVDEWDTQVRLGKDSIGKYNNNTYNTKEPVNINSKVNVNLNSKPNVNALEENRIDKSIDKNNISNTNISNNAYKTNLFNLIDNCDIDDELKVSIKEWVTYKIEKKEKYTNTGFTKFLTQVKNQAKANGVKAVIDIIDYSISNNWKGILWEKIVAKPSQPYDYKKFI